MSIYDKISKMLGRESEAEKLYKVLNTDEYKERPYEYSDLGEGMAVIGETMLGWWKHRFLINHNTKCAYEFMNKDQKLVTVTEDDIFHINGILKQRSNLVRCKSSDTTANTGNKELVLGMLLGKQDKLIHVWFDGIDSSVHGWDGIALTL